jgi:hypothetical protein
VASPSERGRDEREADVEALTDGLLPDLKEEKKDQFL